MTHEAAEPTTPNLRELGYLSIADVAGLLDVKPVTLANWRSSDKGPPYTVVHGNHVVYPETGVREFLKQRTIRPAEQPTLVHGKRRRRAA